ncbi:RING/U-box superfamily protein [Quillaja saponaria]|uniref:RING/U-box superfamily protein n=1 Tax=Quillaja saponaria TaxID=32244 RepID=A0AAD7KP60_QUISA|nr:RING/U-box superfamily protein [Quillaja saponaria]
MVPHEPYWRTNTSFSPPPSRWDFRFQPEGPPHGLHDGTQLHGSSTSSSTSSEESRSLGPQWTPPAIQEISADDYETSIRRDPSLGRISFTPTKEGTSENPASGGSTSSHSDGSESEPTLKSYLSSQRNFSSRRSFISKPIHPLSFTDDTPSREAFDTSVADFSEFGAVIPLRDAQRWSSASSNFDFRDASESFDTEISGCSHTPSVGYRCGLCERFLSQRSPWGSCRIVRSGDMPISGVLSCCHVFHAECLEQITPKTRKNDPPCPLCIRFEEENSPDQKSLMRLRNGFPRLRPHCEDGPSRPWGCSQASDCVEGALHASPRNAMLLLNRNRIKKNLSLKGNLRKEFPGKLKKSGSYSSQLFVGKSVDQGTVGCSKGTAGPSTQR